MVITVGNRDAEVGEIRGYDVRSGEPVKTFRVESSSGIRWAAYAPDGKTLATAEYDGTVKLRDPATGKVGTGSKPTPRACSASSSPATARPW